MWTVLCSVLIATVKLPLAEAPCPPADLFDSLYVYKVKTLEFSQYTSSPFVPQQDVYLLPPYAKYPAYRLNLSAKSACAQSEGGEGKVPLKNKNLSEVTGARQRFYASKDKIGSQASPRQGLSEGETLDGVIYKEETKELYLFAHQWRIYAVIHLSPLKTLFESLGSLCKEENTGDIYKGDDALSALLVGDKGLINSDLKWKLLPRSSALSRYSAIIPNEGSGFLAFDKGLKSISRLDSTFSAFASLDLPRYFAQENLNNWNFNLSGPGTLIAWKNKPYIYTVWQERGGRLEQGKGWSQGKNTPPQNYWLWILNICPNKGLCFDRARGQIRICELADR